MNKFKVGDKVITVESDFGIPVGRIGTITELCNEKVCRVKILNWGNMDYNNYFYYSQFRLATPLDEVLA